MNKRSLIRFGALLTGLLLSAGYPSFASSGTEGAAFLDIPVGAGPAALGSAYTALANNAYAPTWNPAGLGFLGGNEIAAQHLSYLEAMNYEYLSFVHPFGGSEGSFKRGIGFSVQYLGSGDIDRTDLNPGAETPQNYGDPIGDFSSYYSAYNLAYGQKVGEKLSLGITGKMIRAKIDDVTASAYAADLGGLYRMNEKIQVGASIVNMGSKLKFLNEGDSLPLAFKAGVAFQPNSRWLGSSEVVYRGSGLASFHAGGQWRPIEAVALRVGYKTDTLKGLSPLAGLSVGLGLFMWGQEFAYAWAPYGELGDAQYVSLLIRFGARDEARRNLIQYQNIKKHRTVKGAPSRKDDVDPDYQQLMQLLSGDDSHVARGGAASRSESER